MAHEDGITTMLSCISEDDSSIRSTEITNCANIRRNVGLQYRVSVVADDHDIFTTDCHGSSEVDRSLPEVNLGESLAVADHTKPVIHDVRLLKKSPLQPNAIRRPLGRTLTGADVPISRASSTALDCLLENQKRKSRLGRTASTFGHVTHRNVFIDIGEYQTLLRPTTDTVATDDVADQSSTSRQVTANGGRAASISSISTATAEDRDTYTLPSSLDYGDDTLRAIALITEKFDSFRRRQQRVRSFLHSRSINSSTRSRGGATRRDNSTCSRSSGVNASMTSPDRMSRVAIDHDFVPLPSTPDDDDLCQGHVTAAEMIRARLFYSSVSTQVVTCRSLADVFLGACAMSANGTTKRSPASGAGVGTGRSDSMAACTGWVHVVTGIPTLVLSTGIDGRGRRELAIVVADRQTGFPVWRDRVSYLSDYRQAAPGVHTMRVSGGLTKRVKFDIFSGVAADDFLASYCSMTSDPADELWKMSTDKDEHNGGKHGRHRNGNRKRAARGRHVRKTLTTSDISQPCDPRWVTRVDPNDSNFRSAFGDFLPSILPVSNDLEATMTTEGAKVASNGVDDDFRPRLPTN